MNAIVSKKRSYNSKAVAYLSDKHYTLEISFIEPILKLSKELGIYNSDCGNAGFYEYGVSLDAFVDDVLRRCRNKEILQGTDINHSFLMLKLESYISRTRGNVIVYDCETPEEIELLRSKGAVIIGIDCDDNYDHVIRSGKNLYKNLDNIVEQYGFQKRNTSDNIIFPCMIAVFFVKHYESKHINKYNDRGCE